MGSATFSVGASNVNGFERLMRISKRFAEGFDVVQIGLVGCRPDSGEHGEFGKNEINRFGIRAHKQQLLQLESIGNGSFFFGFVVGISAENMSFCVVFTQFPDVAVGNGG